MSRVHESQSDWIRTLSKEAALEEIGKNIGTQFDPYIAKLFMEFV